MSRLTTNPRADGRFLVRKKLGAGSMGIVYEAVDRERDEVVALKTLIHSEAADLYRFKREFRTLADIDHPNLVSLYELFVEDGRCYFTMQRVRGVNFLEYVRPRHGVIESASTLAGASVDTEHFADDGRAPAPEPAAAPSPDGGEDAPAPQPAGELVPTGKAPLPRIGRLRTALRGLAEGVSALHAAGKVHRDLKPSNVMVEDSGRVVILDFGLAADLTQTSSRAVADGLHGTAAYMAPEQADQQPCTPASDWYAVGVMLYEALAGRRPHTGTILHVLMDKRKIDPPPPQTLVDGLPADLCDLCMALLDRDPTKRPDGAAILQALGARTETREHVAHSPRAARLVGRDDELAALTAAAARVDVGFPVAAFVHGVSGVGKSALVRAFLASQQEAYPDIVILPGRCHVRESVPFKALDGVVDQLSRYLLQLPDSEARVYVPRDLWALARVFPVMRTVIEALGAHVPLSSRGEGPGQRPPDLVEVRRRAFAALRELLGRIASRHRVIVVIDDLQWADADSAALLDDLLRPPTPPAIMLIASFRSEDIEGEPLLGRLLARTRSDDGSAIQIELRQLSDAQIRDLALELFGGPRARQRHARHIDDVVREAAGSPFLVEQLVRHVLSGDVLSGPGLTLLEMLESQIARQPVGARPLLDVLSAAARPVQPDIAFRAAKLGPSANPRGLVKRLRAANLLRFSGAAEDLELYHDRLREALLADVAKTRGAKALRKIHARLAKALVRAGSQDFERLYVHHRDAGKPALAATFAAKAAERAAEALAFDQAANFYRAALDLAPVKDSDVIDHRLLEQGLGDALANAGRCRPAAHAYLRAAALVTERRALELRRLAAQQLLMSGHIDEGQAVLDDVLTEAGLRLARSPRTALISLLAHRARLRLRGTSFTERPRSEIPQDLLFKIDVCWAVSTGLGMIDSTRAADFQVQGLLMALEAGDPLRVSLAESMEAAFVASAGVKNRAQAAELARDALALANREGEPHAIALATMTVGACAYMVGEWRRAATRCHEADVMLGLRCTGVPWETATTRRFWMSALLRLGEYKELDRCLPEFQRDANERGNLYASTDFRGRLNTLWLVHDDPRGARADIDDVMQRWSTRGWHVQHWNALLARAQADLYEGDPASALERLDTHWGKLRRSLLLRVEVIRVDAHELRARARIAMIAGGQIPEGRPREQAFKKIAKDISTLEALRVAWVEPLVALLRAGVAELQGQRLEAIAALRSAVGGFDMVDMAGWATAARRQLGQLLQDDSGPRLLAQADEWLKGQGVVAPARFARMLVAGFKDRA